MSSKANGFETGLLQLIFNNTDYTTVGDSGGLRGSVTAGSLYVSLHTSDPGEAGDQTTNEVTTGQYGQYARKDVARSAGGWTITGNSVSPTAAINFTQMTTGTGATATHFGIGTAASGAGKLLYYGPLDPDIVLAAGVTPQITTASTITEN